MGSYEIKDWGYIRILRSSYLLTKIKAKSRPTLKFFEKKINSLQIYLFPFKWMFVYKKWVDLQTIVISLIFSDIHIV